MKPLTRSFLSSLSPSDLVAELTARGVKQVEVTHLKGITTCPHCGHEGPIEKDFGIRIMRGEVWPQSWCRTCRAGREEEKKVAKAAKKKAEQSQQQRARR